MTAATSSETVLELSAVTRRFSTQRGVIEALKDVSFEVNAGKITGLIGPDAAGKTTLMRCVAGLLPVDSGSIEVLGHDVAHEALVVQSDIGYMPQRFGLYEDLTVLENLNLYADLQGVPVEERPERYAELMRMTALGDFLKRRAGRLSGGMKQKLGLACSLIRSPRLLLLDEPTVGVDPLSRRELWQIVYQLVHESATSVILSTAYLDEAERCDAVVLLHEGRVLGEDAPPRFIERMRGRTWSVSSKSVDRRETLSMITGRAGVTDAVLQGENVRLVTERAAEPDAAALLPDAPDAQITAVPPRFEDAFVTLLRESGKSEQEHGQALPSETKAVEKGDGDIIVVHDLTRKFGQFYAVRDVSFSVKRGEVFGLLGANGAGKSTTFRMLCGLLPATSGNLQVAGMDLRHAASAARARIGYMSQKFSLYGQLTVRQNLDFFSQAYGLRGKERAERVEWVLEHFDLKQYEDTNGGLLPLGFQQRLAMAVALIHQPEILFLDEPTSGVDPLARRVFWARINALAQRGITVMVTTHFMEEAEYCDRLAIMEAGKILTIGSPADIRRNAGNPEKPNPTLEEAFIHLVEADRGAA